MTIFATGGFHGLNYVEEASYGQTPVNPGMKALRHTSCSLVLTKESFQSQELRPDAQISDLRHGNRQVGGDIGYEFSFAEYEDLLAAALRSTWQVDGDNRYLVTGVEHRSFTFERVFNDIQQYERFSGCMVNTLSLSVATNAMVTGTVGLVGKNADFSATPLAVDPVPSQTASPFDGFSGAILEGGTTIAVVSSVEISIDNGMSPAFVIGSDSAAAMTPGRINITGTLSAYFYSLDLLNKFLNEDDSSLVLTLGDSVRKTYVLTFPRIKYSGGDNPSDGEGAIMLSMPFQAIYDPCTGTSMRIDAIAGPAITDCALTYAGTEFNESSVNPGAIDAYHTVTLAGGDGTKYFNGVIGQDIPGVIFADVPVGLTGHFQKESNTQGRIYFSGTAEESITTTAVTITFGARAFSFGFCGCPGGTITDTTKILTINPA